MVDQQLTFAEHLSELKKRLTWIGLAFVIGTGLGFLIHKQIESIIQKPLGETLYFSTPGGGLSWVVQVSVIVGMVFALPITLFQVAQFIRPAVKSIKTTTIIMVVIISMLLTVLAVLYTYFISLPAALKFLVGFNSDALQSLINVNDYMRFISAYIAGSIIAFQFPLIMIFINKIKKIPPGGLLKMQKPIIVGIVVVSGILTPTIDPLNQLLMALPMFLLFEVGVIAVSVSNKSRSKSSKLRNIEPGYINRRLIATKIKLIPNVLCVQNVVSSSSRIGMDVFVQGNNRNKNFIKKPPITVNSTSKNTLNEPKTVKNSRLIMDIMAPTA
jgi:sec-independent protein translocase protein TatC